MLHSDARHIWLVEPDRSQDQITIWHGDWSVQDPELHYVDKLHGRVMLGKAAASSATLWLVYSDMTVQFIKAIPASSLENMWAYEQQMIQALPGQSIIRAMTAGNAGPCVLLQVRTAELEDQLDQFSADDELTLSGLKKQELVDLTSRGVLLQYEQAGISEQQRGEADTDHSEKRIDQSTSGNHEVKLEHDGSSDNYQSQASSTIGSNHLTDLLLLFRRGRWQMVDLPGDWDMTLPVQLIMQRSADVMPVILSGDSDEPAMWLYRYRDGQWVKQVVADAMEAAFRFRMAAVTLQDQLIIARKQGNDDTVLAVMLSAIRDHGQTEIGELRLDLPASSQWAVVPKATDIALVGMQVPSPVSRGDQSASAATRQEPIELIWSSINLQGEVVDQDCILTRRYGRNDVELYGLFLFFIFVGLMSLLAVVFIRRDPNREDMHLPEHLMPGDFDRRLVAGWIDLLPGFIAVWYVYPVKPGELLMQWMDILWHVTNWHQVQPVLLVIIIFVVHTTVSELFTGRTLGKALTGLRVVTRDGRSAGFGQKLIRGLMKCFDLIAWFLLIIPLLTPYRQRLGDLLAGTIVVMETIKDSDKSTGGDQESGKDEP